MQPLTSFIGRIPLTVFLAKAHDHDVSIFEKRSCANQIYCGTLAVPIRTLFLHAKNDCTAIIGVFMGGDGRLQANWQRALLNTRCDAYTRHVRALPPCNARCGAPSKKEALSNPSEMRAACRAMGAEDAAMRGSKERIVRGKTAETSADGILRD
eukprot:6209273-Pleurochrysis_carterae.AAC.1